MLHKNGSSHRRCSVKEGVLRNFAKFTGKHRKASLAQVFFCEFCEISKNTFFTEHLWQLLLKGLEKSNKDRQKSSKKDFNFCRNKNKENLFIITGTNFFTQSTKR